MSEAYGSALYTHEQQSSREWPSRLQELRLESCWVCLLFSQGGANWHGAGVHSRLPVCRGDNDNQIPHGVQRWQKYSHAKGLLELPDEHHAANRFSL